MQTFADLPRERLTALSVFFRREDVPAGRVLAQQGEPADRLMLIEGGAVALIREGENGGNPMDPYASKAGHVVPGGAAAIRSALEQGHTGMGRKRYALLSSAEQREAALNRGVVAGSHWSEGHVPTLFALYHHTRARAERCSGSSSAWQSAPARTKPARQRTRSRRGHGCALRSAAGAWQTARVAQTAAGRLARAAL